MAVPKKRVSSHRRDKRRSHHSYVQVHLTTCSNCKTPKRTHHICQSCGSYRDKVVK